MDAYVHLKVRYEELDLKTLADEYNTVGKYLED